VLYWPVLLAARWNHLVAALHAALRINNDATSTWKHGHYFLRIAI